MKSVFSQASRLTSRSLLNTKTIRCFSTTPIRESSTLSVVSADANRDDTVLHHASIQAGGKFIDVGFADNTAYRFHSGWIKDSLPSAIGPETHRLSVSDVWDLADVSATKAQIDKDSLVVSFNQGKEEKIDPQWIKSWAPFVGKPLNTESVGMHMTEGTSSLFEALLPKRKGWTADSLDVPKFDANRLLDGDVDYQISFLENMIDPGVALIENIGAPESLERAKVGKPLDNLIFEVVGKMNPHPIREQRYGVVQKKNTAAVANQGKDYNHSDPLSMHTDHSHYNGIPGFLQFMYQAEGSVMSKVCDGLAVAEHVRENFPAVYDLLCSVEITHSIRSKIYTKEGKSRDFNDPTSIPWEFELVHTHPILQVKDGQIERIVQGETKRGVCSFNFDQYDNIMDAYKVWTKLCEDPMFVKSFHWPEHTVLVTNNWRILHGRASVPPEVERTMVFGYANRNLVDNRYRLLKMKQHARDTKMPEEFLMRNPNQVLMYLLESAK